MTGRPAAAPGSDPELPARVIRALAGRRLTVATAESLTGGLLAATLTEVPGASAVVRGGLVVYATDLKATLAGVDRELLDRVGPVDPEVGRALAAGARERCGADLGIGLTGVAGPDPQGGHPVGTCHIALDGPVPALTSLGPADFAAPVSRAAVRAACVTAALDLLLRSVTEL
ncbi:nicotinamide-nucleotide amidohydrolase family protein [Nakamurella sp. YIM 132087]|uniref:Nicotinamide-nucleotide amidohydrolase family protein n=1 Tax=Nakamurella alba TaxID=2665158 RepID=A0A7K1FM54_9ACTN|nr:nicotinamide-nucleotide amidohydrolase family protein [Nakamurella alba]MTD13964.1 nicotinamide-nucleotide amidohydrolase family protein [Nakamurella alba]